MESKKRKMEKLAGEEERLGARSGPDRSVSRSSAKSSINLYNVEHFIVHLSFLQRYEQNN